MLNIKTVQDLRELIQYIPDDTPVVLNLYHGLSASEIPVVFQETGPLDNKVLRVIGLPKYLEQRRNKETVWSNPTTHTRLALVIE